MHLLTIAAIIALAWAIRYQSSFGIGTWSERWHKALFVLLFPSLLLLSTAIAILYMGCHGAMLGMQVGSLGCAVSATAILLALGCLGQLAYRGSKSIRQLSIHRQQLIEGIPARIIDLDLPYSAQIGFWQSELLVSSGLLTTLDQPHLAAVLAHEQAHVYYRDTFWFFWLGWMRYFTCWLPKTEALWQELLLLRELRADQKAATEVDFLLLAESLLTVAKTPLESAPIFCASFNDYAPGDRLNERINSLLTETSPVPANRWYSWSWVCLLFFPLLTIPLHY